LWWTSCLSTAQSKSTNHTLEARKSHRLSRNDAWFKTYITLIYSILIVIISLVRVNLSLPAIYIVLFALSP